MDLENILNIALWADFFVMAGGSFYLLNKISKGLNNIAKDTLRLGASMHNFSLKQENQLIEQMNNLNPNSPYYKTIQNEYNNLVTNRHELLKNQKENILDNYKFDGSEETSYLLKD